MAIDGGDLVALAIAAVGGGGLWAVIGKVVDRGKTRADTVHVIVDASSQVISQLREQNESLHELLRAREERIDALKAELNQQRALIKQQDAQIVDLERRLAMLERPGGSGGDGPAL